jgi:hypothetical protein
VWWTSRRPTPPAPRHCRSTELPVTSQIRGPYTTILQFPTTTPLPLPKLHTQPLLVTSHPPGRRESTISWPPRVQATCAYLAVNHPPPAIIFTKEQHKGTYVGPLCLSDLCPATPYSPSVAGAGRHAAPSSPRRRRWPSRVPRGELDLWWQAAEE